MVKCLNIGKISVNRYIVRSLFITFEYYSLLMLVDKNTFVYCLFMLVTVHLPMLQIKLVILIMH